MIELTKAKFVRLNEDTNERLSNIEELLTVANQRLEAQEQILLLLAREIVASRNGQSDVALNEALKTLSYREGSDDKENGAAQLDDVVVVAS